MKPYLQDADFTLYNGDALEVLRELPDESVQMCVTSPPFFGLRDYGCEGQIGLEETPEAWVASLVAVFDEVRRVLRSDGTLWVECGDSYAQGASGSRTWEGGKEGGETAWMMPRPWATTGPGLKPKDLIGQPFLLAQALRAPRYLGRITNELDRVWLAAMVEAEGCMFIHRRKAGQSNGQGYERKNDTYGAGLEVASTDRVVAERCLAITGLGSICEQSPTANNRRKQTIYRWNLRSNVCREIIAELYPYFIAKQHEARLLLGCPSSGPKAAEAHESLKALHQGGRASIDFKAPDPKALNAPWWYWRNTCIWHRPNPMPESVRDRFTVSHSYVLLFSKSPRYFFDAEAVRESHAPVTLADKRFGATGTGRERYDDKGMGAAPSGFTGAHPAGRNARSVWTIPTEPLPFEHYAAFPQALAERCIKAGTSERGCCPECGAGWVRIVEVESSWRSRSEHGAQRGNLAPEGFVGAGTQRAVHGAGVSHDLDSRRREVLGWEPSCDHHTHPFIQESYPEPIPCTVLDPFLGSGTTALVARRLGRRCIGIELNETYCKLAAQRTQQLSLEAQGPAPAAEATVSG